MFKKFLVDCKPSNLSAKYSKVILKFVIPILASNEKFLEATGRLDKFGRDTGNKIIWIFEVEKHFDVEQQTPQSDIIHNRLRIIIFSHMIGTL